MTDPNAWHEEEFAERVPVDSAGCVRGVYDRPAGWYVDDTGAGLRVPGEPTQWAVTQDPVDLADHGAATDAYLAGVGP